MTYDEVVDKVFFVTHTLDLESLHGFRECLSSVSGQEVQYVDFFTRKCFYTDGDKDKVREVVNQQRDWHDKVFRHRAGELGFGDEEIEAWLKAIWRDFERRAADINAEEDAEEAQRVPRRLVHPLRLPR